MASRCAALCLALIIAVPTAARGQVESAARSRMQLLNRKAMEAYDLLEFEDAKNALLEALSVARESGVKSGEELVQTFLNMGVIYGAGFNDRMNAIKYFTAALRLDPSAKLDPTRASPTIAEMFETARESAASAGRSRRPQLRHSPVDEASAGRAIKVWAWVDPGLGPAEVALQFRTPGSGGFVQVSMKAQSGGRYVGIIPARFVRGKSLHYFLEARDAEGSRLAGHGSAASPNIVMITGTAPPPPPEPDGPGGKVFSIAVMAGAGAGVVNGGESENEQPQVQGDPRPVEINPGGAVTLLHIAPELTYHINDKWAVGALGRVQLVNAVDENSHISLLAEARAKRYFGDGALRFYLAFGAGGGQIRHRIPLGDYDAEQDPSGVTPDDRVDTRVGGFVAFGLGGGIQYMLSRYFGLVAELNGLVLVPDFAAHLDLNAGFLLSF